MGCFPCKEKTMGLFKKKPVVVIEDDEQIKREIRARVAKQAGIHDEEYVQTGKMGRVADPKAKIETVEPKPKTTASPKPETVSKAVTSPKPETMSKAVTSPKPETVSKAVKPAKKQKGKRGRKNLLLVLAIIVLLLAFIPLYYFLTGLGEKNQQDTTEDTIQTLQQYDPLILCGETIKGKQNEKSQV
jgi:hypothetical protein